MPAIPAGLLVSRHRQARHRRRGHAQRHSWCSTAAQRLPPLSARCDRALAAGQERDLRSCIRSATRGGERAAGRQPFPDSLLPRRTARSPTATCCASRSAISAGTGTSRSRRSASTARSRSKPLRQARIEHVTIAPAPSRRRLGRPRGRRSRSFAEGPGHAADDSLSPAKNGRSTAPVGAGETRVTSSVFTVDRPQLWWPAGSGEHRRSIQLEVACRRRCRAPPHRAAQHRACHRHGRGGQPLRFPRQRPRDLLPRRQLDPGRRAAVACDAGADAQACCSPPSTPT